MVWLFEGLSSFSISAVLRTQAALEAILNLPPPPFPFGSYVPTFVTSSPPPPPFTPPSPFCFTSPPPPPLRWAPPPMRQISYLCLATGCFSRNRGLHPPQYLTICLSIDLSVYPSIYPVIQLASYQSPNLTIYLIIVSRWVSVHCSFLKVCFVFIYKLLVTIGFFLLFAEAGLSKKNKTKYIILSKVFFPPPSTRPSHFSQNAKSRVLKVEEKKKALSLSLSLYGVLL